MTEGKHEPIPGFDAREWAALFDTYIKRNPAIATDPETMTTWFSAAIMRGYDEGRRISCKKPAWWKVLWSYITNTEVE